MSRNHLCRIKRPDLEKLGITTADKILFVADGAKWIWDRVQPLMKSLGLQEKQFFELLDFYHAVEHVAKVSSHVIDPAYSESKS